MVRWGLRFLIETDLISEGIETAIPIYVILPGSCSIETDLISEGIETIPVL